MKAKLAVLTLVGLIAGHFTALAQTNTTDAAAAPEPTVVADAPAEPVVPAPPTASELPPTAPTPVPEETPAVAMAEMSTNASSQAVIPLIAMDDVLLTDAIKNLARQAGLNYMLDPKLNFSQPGNDGQGSGQPTVSIRWENITAEQALTALLNNYNLQMIMDPKTKIARITFKDPAAPEPLLSKIIQLRYADPKDMAVAVQTALIDRRDKVLADIRTSQLIILATEKELEAVDEMILRLDSPTKQVLIEAKIYETTANPSTMKGIDWSGTLQSQHFTFGNGVLSGDKTYTSSDTPVTTTVTTPGTGRTYTTTSSGGTSSETTSLISQLGSGGLSATTKNGLMPAVGFLNADGVSAVLSFLNADTDTRVIATPRAVTLDNQTATLAVTRSIPIFNTTAGTQGSPGGSSVTYSNVGTILNVTPRISANNDIQLKVVPEVSNDAGLDKQTINGETQEAHIFDSRRIDTQVLIPSGTTLVLGGLMSDQSSRGYTKVPLMGDVPVLGGLFRSKSKSQLMQNLIIFITPTIVTQDAFHPTKTDFLSSTANDLQYHEPGAWDSAKPYDWSKHHSSADSFASEQTPKMK